VKKIKDRYQAETAFCDLFVSAGRRLGVPAFGEPECEGSEQELSATTIAVIHECEFYDPHFIGGPCKFNFAKSHEDVERIFLRAEPTAAELSLALEKKHPEHAQKFRTRLDSLKSWLHDNVDKWAA